MCVNKVLYLYLALFILFIYFAYFILKQDIARLRKKSLMAYFDNTARPYFDAGPGLLTWGPAGPRSPGRPDLPGSPCWTHTHTHTHTHG